jgi:hypothetical protein
MVEAEQESEHPRSEDELRSLYMDSHEEDILLDPETQCEWLRAIGFEHVEVYFKAIELAIFAGVKPATTESERRGSRRRRRTRLT